MGPFGFLSKCPAKCQIAVYGFTGCGFTGIKEIKLVQSDSPYPHLLRKICSHFINVHPSDPCHPPSHLLTFSLSHLLRFPFPFSRFRSPFSEYQLRYLRYILCQQHLHRVSSRLQDKGLQMPLRCFHCLGRSQQVIRMQKTDDLTGCPLDAFVECIVDTSMRQCSPSH